MMATFEVDIENPNTLKLANEMLIFELGYKMCEKGYNIQKAKEEFKKITSATYAFEQTKESNVHIMKTKDEIAFERYRCLYNGDKPKYSDLCSSRQRTVDQLFELQQQKNTNEAD